MLYEQYVKITVHVIHHRNVGIQIIHHHDIAGNDF